MSSSSSPPHADPSTSQEAESRRIAAVVGLRLLELIRSQDLPSEVLEDEDPSVTMPRRLGLSDVVERQIRSYREAVRRRRRMSETELRNLVGLVVRRRDAEEIFYRAGHTLVDEGGGATGPVVRLLPDGVGFLVARRRARRGLRRLFGRHVGTFTPGPFALEGRSLILWRADPGGEACAFVSGFCQAVLAGAVGPHRTVIHNRCQARGDETCRWTVVAENRAREREAEAVGDLLRGPEPEAG
jgi:hypothetical protein